MVSRKNSFQNKSESHFVFQLLSSSEGEEGDEEKQLASFLLDR